MVFRDEAEATAAMARYLALVESDEPYDPDLVDFLETSGRITVLRHPLVVDVMPRPGVVNEQFRERRKVAARLRGEDYEAMLRLIEKPFRLAVVAGAYDEWAPPDDDAFLAALPYAWESSEPDDTDPGWLSLWRNAWWVNGRQTVTDADEPLDFPATVTVYRGEQPGGEERGIAWTAERHVAEYFANRKGIDGLAEEPGIVFVGEVSREDIMGYLVGRNEFEVIANPENVTVVATETAPPPAETAARAKERRRTAIDEVLKDVGDDFERLRATMFLLED